MSGFPSIAILALLPLFAAACGGGGGTDAAPGETGGPAEAASGVPVAAPSGPIDEALAERGEDLFARKGCVGCHTIGKGRLTGPDLAGVTERREWEWFYHMVTSPDSMAREDPVAKQLLAEYMTPMPDLDVQPDEVRALYEHIREESAEAADEDGGEES